MLKLYANVVSKVHLHLDVGLEIASQASNS